MDELQEKFPRHDIAACLRRARLYVQRERGPSAAVTIEWFTTHWMPNEAEAAPPQATSARAQPEPANWREWCRANFPDFTGLENDWTELDSFQQTFIRDRMRTSA